MAIEGELLSVMFEAFPTFWGVPWLENAFENFLHVALDISLDVVNLYDVLSDVVVLDFGNLSVLIPFLHQVAEVVSLHLLDNFYESVVEGRSEVDLLPVFIL